ncbi:tetratricopeptide repeat protein [Singulisphaera sp. PoT]|uniref:tetratricopeptide repeat protein n=1 Tax=Singulisphaera sp. PoT TaxID=3411797 RepID=UPI003BF505F1
MLSSGRDTSEWVEQQVELMASAWERGEPIPVEDILARNEGLGPEASVRLIYEEIVLRREAGRECPSAEIDRRFPQWAAELRLLLECNRLLLPLTPPLAFPEAGDRLGPFRLVAEIGRGASGRTFLASEPALADRAVVLKLIPYDHREHLSLARLQHTHIVPLFSEQAFPERGLRALCMPALGGASLDRILGQIQGKETAGRHGRDLVAALACSPSTLVAPPANDSPYRRYLEQTAFVPSACWIAACLADALHYAHERGVVHMDVKPSNVLISADGQPMLLDFHLARPPGKADDSPGVRLGGTAGWMSPEQASTFEALRTGREPAAAIDRRSDIYSLGLLLCEMLGGPGARLDAAAGKPWHENHPDVSIPLARVVARCLEPSADDRYQDGASLADDLRRLLGETSSREPGPRARLRSPLMRWGIRVSVSAAVALVIGLAALAPMLDWLTLRDALRPATALRDPRSRRIQGAAEVHELADALRFRYGIDLPTSAEARELEAHCRRLWRDREALLDRKWGDLEAEGQLRTDLRELALAVADFQTRLSAPERAESSRQEALRVLAEAESSLGPSPAIERRRHAYGAVFGPTAAADSPTSPWERYDLGRFYLRTGRFDLAVEEFERALEERPQDYWPHFYLGLSCYRLGRFHDAVSAFRVCLALEPNGVCYFNRGLAWEALGRLDRASKDYGQALALDPRLAAAALNRGILSHRQGHYAEAIEDYRRALLCDPAPELLGRIHYHLAVAHLARGDSRSALASHSKALEFGSEEARILEPQIRRSSRRP